MRVPDARLIEFQRGIYQRTRSRTEPVRRVMPWVLDRGNLEAAWRRVASSDGARTPGPDRKTVADFARRKGRWLDQLAVQLKQGTFQPSPPRFVDVPKSTGSRETRRLAILNVADRIVQTAVKQVFDPIFDPTFHACSYGFRPGRSVPGALADAVRKLNTYDGLPSPSRNKSQENGRTWKSILRYCGDRLPFPYACKLDVANCFDTIDHVLLDARLREIVADEAALTLVRRLVEVGGVRRGWWWNRRGVGVAQGGALSPLLCNAYLDSLDWELAELSRESGGAVQLLRYADDLLLLASDRRRARQAVLAVERALADLRQGVKRSKSQVTRSVRGIRWLGMEVRPRDGTFKRQPQFGYFVPDEKLKRMTDVIAEMTAPPPDRLAARAINLGCWLESLNEQLDDWWQAYSRADNATVVFGESDDYLYEQVGELLYAVTGERRRTLLRRYGTEVRGRKTWKVAGVTLEMLSSRPRPRPITGSRRPAWMSSAQRVSVQRKRTIRNPHFAGQRN